MFRSKPRPTESDPNVQEDTMTTTNTPSDTLVTVTELHAELVAEDVVGTTTRADLARELADHLTRDDVGRECVPRTVAADVLARYRAATEAERAEREERSRQAAAEAARRREADRRSPRALRNRYMQAVAEEESAEADIQMTRSLLAAGEPTWEDPAVWQARRAREEASLPAMRRRLTAAREAVDDARRAMRDANVGEHVDVLRAELGGRGAFDPFAGGAR